MSFWRMLVVQDFEWSPEFHREKLSEGCDWVGWKKHNFINWNFSLWSINATSYREQGERSQKHGPACVVVFCVRRSLPTIGHKMETASEISGIVKSINQITQSCHHVVIAGRSAQKKRSSKQEKSVQSAQSARGLGCRPKLERRLLRVVQRIEGLCTAHQHWGFHHRDRRSHRG